MQYKFNPDDHECGFAFPSLGSQKSQNTNIVSDFQIEYITAKKKLHMPMFEVRVVIENKPGISDPEGTTILNDLVLKGSYSSVKKIRAAKMLRFQINTTNKKAAENTVKKLCNDLRIYNPMVSKVTFTVN